ncbi:uncharacterized protein FMAN_01727 [Fusarium mangiferae]|uniref:BTB domain-containing protein n=1 Tax=Fusarium mangiferae TaxID=192010 RepID=A0A1L7SGJ4_FUSMA|nr:uncharacterized protein FMAN_01727 [Fusarium mangiferae]CVK84800.1 uncharacterized protein FMAN_01727 [Fusarium mangiferae]
MRCVTYEIDPQGAIEVILQDPDTQRTSPTLTTPIQTQPTPQQRNVKSVKVKKGEEEEEQDTPRRDDKEVQIRMRVSSHHLSLASPVLSSLLQQSAEANEIYLTGWDAKALATVLNVIHGRNAQIPRNVNFEFLTQVASIVHHLKCTEAVQLLSAFWLSTLEQDTVTCFNSNCILWLFNSWVFSWGKEFSHCAQLVLSHYRGPDTVILRDLPLTEVLDKIDGMRIVLIKKVFTALENLEQTLSTERGCPEAGYVQCTAMALGALIRGKRTFRNVEEPYNGLSIRQVMEVLGDFPRMAAACPDANHGQNCTVYARLRPVIEGVEGEIEDIELSYFQS